MGGASQVLCLPRAAAKRILRTEARIHSGKENWATIARLPVAAVSALCTGFGAEVKCPCRGYLDGVGTRVGRRLSGPSEFRERTPPGSPVSCPLGAFDFRTRIISAALGTFLGSTSKILIHSSSTKKDSPPAQSHRWASWELLYKGWFTLPTTLHRLTVHLWQSDNQQREGADIQRDTAHQKVAVSCCSTHSGNEDYRMSS